MRIGVFSDSLPKLGRSELFARRAERGIAGIEPGVGSWGPRLDPSHFWWQGIDPVTATEALGDRIGSSRGKDTLLYPDRIRRQGVPRFAPPTESEPAPWRFAAVGEGHDHATWAALPGAPRSAGRDGEEGTERSLAGPRRAPARLVGAS